MHNPHITFHKNEYKSWHFAWGEIGVRIEKPFQPTDQINAEIKSAEDLITLMLLVDAAKRAGITIEALKLLFIPYSRQDRVCNPGEALSIKVFADMINSLNIPCVVLYDPHSDVTPALINNAKVVGVDKLLAKIDLSQYTLVSPDQGANKRIEKLKRPYLSLAKQRDPVDGKIVNLYMNDARPIHNSQKLLIVDDICDGGRTFIEVGKLLQSLGAKHIDLYVTYGIFSQGFDVFKGILNNIYFYKDGELVCYSCDKNEFIEKI